MAHLPFPVLESDVRDIVYANWIVPLAAVARLVPPGVEVATVDGATILTVLTYRHGHFGPSLAGPLRRLFPSPLQSNWRLYVKSIGGRTPEKPTVLFLANVFDSDLYAVGTRLFSDVMLSHRALRFVHRCAAGGWVSRVGGGGSAPAWETSGQEATEASLPAPFAAFFTNYRDALTGLCLQDAAIAPIAGSGALAISGIDLPIDIRSAVPLTVDAYAPGTLLHDLGATDIPFCFRVPAVRFRALSEQVLDRTSLV